MSAERLTPIEIKKEIDRLKNEMNDKIKSLEMDAKAVRVVYTTKIKGLQNDCTHMDESGNVYSISSEEDSTLKICKFCGSKL